MNTLAIVVAVALCAMVPLIVTLTVGRRIGLPLRIVAVAAGFYLLNLVAQQPMFLGLRPFVTGPPLLVVAVATPAVYAVSEEVLRYLSWRAGRTMRTHRTSDGALVAGLAWGSTEALVLTALQLAGGAATGIAIGSWVAFAVGRLLAIVTHVGFAHLSVAAYRRSVLFLPLVIVAHFVMDASVFGLTAVLDRSSVWPDVLFGAFAVAAVLISLRLRRQWARDSENNAQLAEQCS